MSYNRFEEISVDNALPCEEVEGQTYTRFQPISATNPYPVMVCDEESYTRLENVSETNPLPIALDDGSYTIFEPLSEANRLPVVLVEGQSYTNKQPVSMTNPSPVINTTEESYVGPLDLVPGAVVAYGVRALSAAWLGQNIFRLIRDSDDAEMDFAADAVTGEAPAAAIAAFLGAAAGYVVTWYDQSGNGEDVTNDTPIEDEELPLFVASAANGKPALSWVGSSQYLESATNISLPNGANTCFAVAKSGGEGSIAGINGDSGENWLDWKLSSNLTSLEINWNTGNGSVHTEFEGTGDVFATLAQYFVADGSVSDSAGDIRLNGAALAGDTSRNGTIGAWSQPIVIGDDASGGNSNPWSGEIIEVLIYPSALSSENRTLVRQNEAAYFNITIT